MVFEGGRDDLLRQIETADILVGFNLKYDLHWATKCELPVQGKRYWCCQVAEFLLGRQQNPYPSLEDTGVRYGIGGKSKVVEEYWERGINTHEIPRDILSEYARRDAELTYQIYVKQQQLVPQHQRVLFSLYMQDLPVLQETEWNGLAFDRELAQAKSTYINEEITKLQKDLDLRHNVPGFNWGSGDHLSALLYGGTIVQVEKKPDGFYKTGARAGQPKFRNVEVEYHLPRQYKPLKGSNLKKEGVWSVDEKFLRLLPKSDLIDGILQIKKLRKKDSTYYAGILDMHKEKNFEPGIIHGQFNQVVARTGRLSSSGPNMQNIEEEAQEIFVTRYA